MNYVSPQFHVVFDGQFSYIYNETRQDDTNLEAIFNELFESCREDFTDLDGDDVKPSNQATPVEDIPE